MAVTTPVRTRKLVAGTFVEGAQCEPRWIDRTKSNIVQSLKQNLTIQSYNSILHEIKLKALYEIRRPLIVQAVANRCRRFLDQALLG